MPSAPAVAPTRPRGRTAARVVCNILAMLAAIAAIPAAWLWHTVGSPSAAASTAVSIVELPAVRRAITSELIYRYQHPENSSDAVTFDTPTSKLIAAGVAGLESPATRTVVRDAVVSGYRLLTTSSTDTISIDVRPGMNAMLDAMRAIDQRVPGLPTDFGVVTIGDKTSRPPSLAGIRGIDRVVALGGLGLAFVGFLAAWLLSRHKVDRKLRGLGWKIGLVGALWVILAQVIRMVPASVGSDAQPWTKDALTAVKAWFASSLTLWAGVVAAIGLAIVVVGAIVGSLRTTHGSHATA